MKEGENMKLIKTSEAVGHVLCHDITRIVKDVEKGAAFSGACRAGISSA